MTGRNLVITGGPLHDFSATTAALVELADQVGLRSEVPGDPTTALDRLVADPTWDLVTVDALWWQMPSDRHAHLRDAWSYRLTDPHAQALYRHVHDGGGLLACHTAIISFDGHPRWRQLLGATWDWGRSGHPPVGEVEVRPTAAGAEHPITSGIGPFAIVDEVYAHLDQDPGLVPLLVSEVDGRDQPVLWTRSVGRGRVVVDLLGHDAGSMAHPDHADVLRRALRWLTDPASGRGPADRTETEVAS